MCDTLVAVGDATADGSVILARTATAAQRGPRPGPHSPRQPRGRGHRQMHLY